MLEPLTSALARTSVARLWSVSGLCFSIATLLPVGCTETKPRFTAIEPASVSNQRPTAGIIRGSNLHPGYVVVLDQETAISPHSSWEVTIGSIPLEEVRLASSSALEIVIPADLTPGPHRVTVTGPRGRHYSLAGLLNVTAGTSSTAPQVDAGGAASSGEPARSVDAGVARVASDAGMSSGPIESKVAEEPLDASVNGPGAELDAAIAPLRDATPDAGSGSIPAPVVCGAFGQPEKLTGFGLAGELYAPTLGPNSQEVLFAEYRSTEIIYVATRVAPGAVFSAAAPVAGINGTDSDGTPFLTKDGLTLFFHSTRAGGPGDRDIWQATRSALGEAWSNVALVPVINSGSTDHLPFVSDDGLVLLFSSNRSGGSGASDLWEARRTSTSVPFGVPAPLEGINTSSDETSPQLSSNGLELYFSSDRPGGVGEHDIWVAKRSDISASFQAPGLLPNVNTALDEFDPSLSPDEQELVYSSERDGSSQLWRVSRTCL